LLEINGQPCISSCLSLSRSGNEIVEKHDYYSCGLTWFMRKCGIQTLETVVFKALSSFGLNKLSNIAVIICIV